MIFEAVKSITVPENIVVELPLPVSLRNLDFGAFKCEFYLQGASD